MNILTVISKANEIQHLVQEDLGKIEAFEAQVAPVFKNVDMSAIENEIASLIVAESKGKVTQAEALLAVQGIVGIGEALGSIASKVASNAK